jgi:predicted SprT family Zn-dependent metalloprotease
VTAHPALRSSFERNLGVYFGEGFPGGSNDVELGFLRRNSFRTIGKADVRRRRIEIHRELVRLEWELVLDFVMHHEMIHFTVLRHNREFKRRERRFRDYHEARRQERAFFRWLEQRRAASECLHAYRCPRCGTRFFYRTRRGHLFACGHCARRYDPRFRLVPVTPMQS